MTKNLQFSIITPTYNRGDGRLQRAIKSVQGQSLPLSYEHIIVDDCSTDLTTEIVASFRDPRIKFAHQTKRSQRCQARNVGMTWASGDWIIWLDSDDALDAMYLATVAGHIAENPSAKLFVCGAVYHGMKVEDKKHLYPVWTKLRQAWIPPVSTDGVHEHFKSGKVGTGMFIYNKSCIQKTGLFPASWNSYSSVAMGVDDWLGYETGYGGERCLPVGNPWGDDWAFFRKLTLFYRAHPIHSCIYIQYVRSGGTL